MIRHVALFRFREDLDKVYIDELMHLFTSLEGKIAGLKSVAAGENVTSEPLTQGFRHGIVMEFDTPAHLETYLSHPLHLPIAGKVIEALATNAEQDIVVFDIQMDPAMRSAGHST